MTLNKKYEKYKQSNSKTKFTKAELIVFEIVKNLRNRRGISQEWDHIDDDIQEEILESLLKITDEELNQSENSLNHNLYEYVKRMPQNYKNACFMCGHSVLKDEINCHYIVTMAIDLERAGISRVDFRIPFNEDLMRKFDYSKQYITIKR